MENNNYNRMGHVQYNCVHHWMPVASPDLFPCRWQLLAMYVSCLPTGKISKLLSKVCYSGNSQIQSLRATMAKRNI